MAMSVVYSNFGGMLVAETREGVGRIYVPDTLGSTVEMTDESGNTTDTFEYWSYGEEKSHTGSSSTPFTWLGILGYFKDILNKLYYVRARYFRPELGRWQTVDPLWPDQPGFLYSMSAPVQYTDAIGLCPPERPCKNCNNAGLSLNFPGAAFCCEGVPVTCVLKSLPTPIKACIQAHEDVHKKRLRCKGKPDFSSPYDPCGECDGYVEQLKCLFGTDCKGDARCDDLKWEYACAACFNMDGFCSGCGKPRPSPWDKKCDRLRPFCVARGKGMGIKIKQ